MEILTIKQLAERLKVDYAAASGFLNVLIAKGLAKEAGQAPIPEGVKQKGKRPYVYEMQTQVSFSLTV